MRSSVRVFAPATISNLGPGFDVIGLALHAPGDLVHAEVSDTPGVQIVEITGDRGALSRDPARNVAGVSALHTLERLRTVSGGKIREITGVSLRLHKQMPIASGLGSSAASSVAGAVAVNALFGEPLSRPELLASALEGERVASGSAHADNVAPSLLGGIVLIRNGHPPEIVSLPVPEGLWLAIVHPRHEVPTAKARALLHEQGFPIDRVAHNLGHLGALISALYESDLARLGRAVDDRLVEPVRAALIPGFHEVKRAALAAGALGCSIAGAGPSVFAFCDSESGAERVAAAMIETFAGAAGLSADRYVGRVNSSGATVD